MKEVAFMDDTAIRNIIGAFDKNAFQSFFSKLVLHFNGGISVPKKLAITYGQVRQSASFKVNKLSF